MAEANETLVGERETKSVKSQSLHPLVELTFTRVREFLRYVLSEEGQRAVAHEGVYLPLPASVVGAQVAKLDFDGVPPERKLLREDD